jgi:hypothetical protein
MNMATTQEVLRAHLPTWLATKRYSKERAGLKKQLATTLKMHPNSVGRALRRIQLTPHSRTETRGRPRIYTKADTDALKLVWEAMDRPCAELLHPMVATYLHFLVEHNRWPFGTEVEAHVNAMSMGTRKRYIALWRKKEGGTRGYSATRPSMLKDILIPIRKSHTWHTLSVGHVQLDTVVHCGDLLTGDIIYSLGAVDFRTYWIEYTAQWNKGEIATVESFDTVRGRFPFPLIEAHPDTGNEFINYHFHRYAEREETKIALTRSEPYKKNDNMCIEERNNTIARRHLGYARLDEEAWVPLVSEILRIACIIHNHFRPVRRMLDKVRIGATWHRTYESVAKTPHLRVMDDPDVSDAKKAELHRLHASLDPLELQEQLDTLKGELTRMISKKRRGS